MADVKLTIYGIDKASDTFRKVQGVGTGAFNKIKSAANSVKNALFSVKGMLAGVGLALSAKSFIDVSRSFEDMKIKLDALTKGRGQETLEKINAWALKMPVNTRLAVDTFTMMQAMGLDPTIDKMQTLTDVSSVFGEDAMPRVARALGQMTTLGMLSAEELNQMAEAGINARKYLSDAFEGKTVAQIRDAGIAIKDVTDAIWKGMKGEFGGAADKAMESWRGVKTSVISYLEEIQRKIMDSGPFKLMKDAGASLVSYMDQNWQEIEKFADKAGKAMVEGIEKALIGSAQVIDKIIPLIDKVNGPLSSMWKTFQSLPGWIKEAGLIGAFIGGKKGTAVVLGGLHLIDAGKQMVEAAKQVKEGNLTFEEFASSNYEELKQKLDALRQQGLSPVKEEAKNAADSIKSINNIDMGPAEKAIRNALDSLKNLSKEKAEPTIDAADDQAKEKLSFIRIELNKLDKMTARPKVIVETFGKGSPTMSFSRYMDYAYDKVQGLGQTVNTMLDFSPLSSAIEKMVSSAGSVANVVSKGGMVIKNPWLINDQMSALADKGFPGIGGMPGGASTFDLSSLSLADKMQFQSKNTPAWVVDRLLAEHFSRQINVTNNNITNNVSALGDKSVAKTVDTAVRRAVKYGRLEAGFSYGAR